MRAAPMNQSAYTVPQSDATHPDEASYIQEDEETDHPTGSGTYSDEVAYTQEDAESGYSTVEDLDEAMAFLVVPQHRLLNSQTIKSSWIVLNSKQKITKEGIWIDEGWYKFFCVCEELRRSEMLLSCSNVKHAEVCVGTEENCKDLKAMCTSLVTSLITCARKKDLCYGSKIHADIRSSGLLEKSIYLGNTLVGMYVKCGALDRAQQVLDELPVRNVVSWNTLIAGYTQQGQGKEALGCFDRMRREGLSPSAITYTCMLKACGITRDVDVGKQIHDEIAKQELLEKDVVVGNALVDMYAKCGLLAKAQIVFDELPIRNVITWNALIAGYAQQGQGQEALDCFHRMQSKGFSPNAITYICILKACGTIQEADVGKKIHDEIINQGLLGKNVVLGNALVDMYVKCSLLAKAQKVLEELPVRNVASWNALITGYVQQKRGDEALGCFHQMRSEGCFPDAITYSCILRACGITQAADIGKKIHDEVVGQGLLEKNVVLGTALIDMYVKCGIITNAQRVFDEYPVRNIFSWSALIAGYAQQRQGKKALACFLQMQNEGLSPDAISYACILKACSITKEIDMGKQIHAEIFSQGLFEKNIVLGNVLVDMYAKCGIVTKAQKVLDLLPVRNVVTWNALIAGYAQQWQGEEALGCFQRMQSEGLSPDAITYVCILKACGITQEVDTSKRIHDEIASQGMLENNVMLGNALVDMYSKCGVLTKARKVLDELPIRDVVTWNALIAGYANQGQGQEALACFQKMRSEGISPNAITYACILKTCGITQEGDMGKQFHDDIASQGLLENNVVLGTAVVDMYAKCGVLTKAQEVLDELPVRNLVTWNALIAGYAQQGQGQEALCCFHRMQKDGLSPDAITYACILKACGIIQEADMGKQIHDEIVNQELLDKHVMLGNALVNMYAKCGVLTKAQKVLEELPVRNVVSWNALIAGYAQQRNTDEALACFHRMRSEGLSPDVVSWSALIGGYAQQGLAEEALDCFQWMQQEGTYPNGITFVSVLSACSHSGLVEEGQMYFEKMREKYNVTPVKEHYTCMVDLFGRARHFDRAMEVINMMSSSDYAPVWYTLLGACQKWRNVQLGRLAFEHAVQLDVCNTAAYVVMANIYAAAGMQKDAQVMEHAIMTNAARKQPGCSCRDYASGNAHKFCVGDTKLLHSRHTHAKLRDLELRLSQQGFSPNLHCLSHTCTNSN